ncbi:glycosyltransferase family 25 protein [Psychrobacter sp. FME13]|uniref:glycosyltransferase family 25 protein n=1 Tax=unclassified Psychrobacter TaxID=196806 RepID=UPI001CE3CFD0|nr:glycosyltransferase family 25 protein [Psychrobacter sp. FME13]
MKVYVVNMDNRPDRWKHIVSQLTALGIEYTRVSAVDGKSLNVEEQKLFDKRRFVLEQKKPSVLGEIGCAMSHRNIWKDIVRNEIKYALVLEDDVNLENIIVDFLSNKSNFEKFDLLNISSNQPYSLQGIDKIKLDSHNEAVRPNKWKRKKRKQWKKMEWRRRWRIFSIKKVCEGFYTCECDPAPALTSGYIISNHGAIHLLNTSESMFYPIDLTWRYSGGKLIEGFLSQPLVIQSLDDTDIHGRYKGYKLNLREKILRAIFKSRRIKRRWDILKMYGFTKL